MKTILSSLIILGLIFLGCASEEPKTQPPKPVKIAVIGKSVHPYWDEVKLGTEAAEEALGVDATFYVPPKEDVLKQVSTIEDFIAKGVDGIAFAASDPNSVVDVIDGALKKGIPCITLDTDAPKTGRHVYIGTGNYQAGRVAGQKMAELLEGKGKIAIGVGSVTADNAKERIKGFEDVIGGYPNIKILEPILVDNEDSATATLLAEQALQKYPNLSGFYGVYAFNGPAAARAIESAEKEGEITIVCFDTTPDIMEFVTKGTIQATVGQKPYMMGYLSVALLYNMVKLGVDNTLMMLPESQIIDTGVTVVTPDTVDEYRKQLQDLGIPVEF